MSHISWYEALSAGPKPKNKAEFALLVLKGMCMGAADLIPGVSGGTVAFITGIYTNLINAVTSINSQVIKKLLKFEVRAALAQIHLGFLIPLLLGVFSAIIGLARVMHFLMNSHPIPTWATFFGLILASIVIVGRHGEVFKKFDRIIALVIGTVVAHFIVNLIPVQTPEGPWFIILCGMIAIMAMILPGISGSFLLLILGKYEFITAALKNPTSLDNLKTILVFAVGATFGLLGFSRVLKFLLSRYEKLTMSALTGVMIGALQKVWPWREVIETKVIRNKTYILREANIFPSELASQEIIAFSLMVFGVIFVLGLDYLTMEKSKT